MCAQPQKSAGTLALAILLLTVLLRSAGSYAAGPATVAFSLDFPGSDPARYSITVESDGHSHYDCSAKVSADSTDTEEYQSDFTVSAATRDRIFDLAARAHYFSGKVDSGKKKLAFTGNKKLSYTDGQRNFTASYNFSFEPAVQELTSLFQGMSATLEYGRHLVFYHRYQKLGLDEELKAMEDEARRGNLAELQAVRPILQEIYDDPSVINVVRARAQVLMQMGSGGPSGR